MAVARLVSLEYPFLSMVPGPEAIRLVKRGSLLATLSLSRLADFLAILALTYPGQDAA